MRAMRRAARHVFTSLSALSLLLTVAVCVLWVQTRSEAFTLLAWRTGDGNTQRTIDAAFGFLRVSTDAERRPVPPDTVATTLAPVTQWDVRLLGFSSWNDVALSGEMGTLAGTYGYHSAFYVSLAAPLLLAACLPTWVALQFLIRANTRRKRAAGRCLGCGYDLRAHTVGARCPECGTSVPARST
jgi:hypothetical protein